MFSRRLFNWVFYGHVWIALAATGLAWTTLRLVYGPQQYASEWPVLTFIFFATLGVYTLHRYLSFRRAGVRPASRRYEIVRNHPHVSLAVGAGSTLLAGIIGLGFIGAIWHSLLWALPLTVFYLTPPLPGWRRLRDLPYVKVIWVAWAWSIMTVEIPVEAMIDPINSADHGGLLFLVGPGSPQAPFTYEIICRLLFTLSVALLFDFRDVILDRSQNVKTVANSHPRAAIGLVLAAMAGGLTIVWTQRGYEQPYTIALTLAYLSVVAVAFLTNERRSENWYAVVVNGLLLVPPLLVWLLLYLGGDAGAGGGL